MPSLPRPEIRTAFGCDIPAIEIYDIGAGTEGTDRYAGLVTQQLANITGFEPNQSEFERLQALNTPRKKYFPHFIGKGGPATFHITQYPGCSSLYEPDPAVINLFTTIGAKLPDGNFALTHTTKVETHKLDDLPELPPCDYMKIDVQGAELDVLQGASTALSQAVVLELEVEFVPLYKNQPLFGDIHTFLRSRNFVLHKFIDVAGRTFRPLSIENSPYQPMSQMLWADAIFVRNFADLFTWTDAQLLKAAAILFEVYCSYDLVLFLLTAYDRRTGAKCANAFTRALASMPNPPFMFLNVKTVP